MTPSTAPRKILVTGGAGYIGSHTAVVLADHGLDVLLYDNLCNSDRGVLGRLEAIAGAPFRFVEGDVRDTALLQRVLHENAIEAVIHFAGLKAVGESVKEPIAYYGNNVAGTISLLTAMQSVGLRTLVFSSSATVYGEPRYVPLDEDHQTSATNPYGRSKLQIEQILADVANSGEPSAEAPWRIACLRYFNPVGAHDSGLIGEDPKGVPNNLMPYISRVASGALPHLGVFGDDYDTKDGTGVRDYIHVMDLAEGHKAALDFLGRQPGWHAFNLGSGAGYSVLELIRTFEKVSKRSVPYQIVARRPGDVAVCYADSQKAERVLNWSAKRAIEDMCASAWRFQESTALAHV